MIGSIWAQTKDRVIGRDGRIPWRYPGDFARFKRITMGAAVIMGRRTWESIGKPLPGRLNVVISSTPTIIPDAIWVNGANRFRGAIESALLTAEENGYSSVWFIGGARIYEAAMPHVDVIDVTHAPDDVPVEGSVLAPAIDLAAFGPCARVPHEEDPRLDVQRFERRRIA